MPNYYTSLNVTIDCGSHENAEKALALFKEMEAEIVETDEDDWGMTGLLCSIDDDAPTCLWICDDASEANVDFTAFFLGQMLDKGLAEGPLSFNFGCHTSAHRLHQGPEANGGGACLIRGADDFKWFTSWRWEAQAREMAEGAPDLPPSKGEITRFVESLCDGTFGNTTPEDWRLSLPHDTSGADLVALIETWLKERTPTPEHLATPEAADGP